jgi:hypothetical protein
MCDLGSPICDLRSLMCDLGSPMCDLGFPMCGLGSPMCDLGFLVTGSQIAHRRSDILNQIHASLYKRR